MAGGVMGFFGNPAFLAVTAVIAIGIVAYEFYQSHRAQKVSNGRRRRRRSNDEDEFLVFERYENSSVNRNTESTNSVQHSQTRTHGLSEEGNELRLRRHASEVKREQHSVQNVTTAEISSSGEISSNEGGCVVDETETFKSLHSASCSTDNLDSCNSHGKNSEISSLNEESEKCKDNIEHEGAKSCSNLEEDSRKLQERKQFETRNISLSASAVEQSNEYSDNTHVASEMRIKMGNNVKGSDNNEIVCSLNRNSLNDTASERLSLTKNVEYRENLEDYQAAKNTKENSETEESLCRCCKENTITTIVLPCAHRYTCEGCAPMLFQGYNKCPICRSEIGSFEPVRN